LIYRIINVPTGKIVADNVYKASTIWQKGVGLLGRRGLEPSEALWLPGVRLIHTVGMIFPIDVLFLDDDFRTTAVRSNILPLRLCFSNTRTKHCIELAAGTLDDERYRAAGAQWTLEQRP
jgi:uncharacterized membrane protein (UPF0127 family)